MSLIVFSCETNDKEHDHKRNRDDENARYRQTRRSECLAAVIAQPYTLSLHHVQVRAHLLLRRTQHRLVRHERSREVLRIPPQLTSHLYQLRRELLLQRRAVLLQ